MGTLGSCRTRTAERRNVRTSYQGIRVLLVDDQRVVRQGLRLLIEAEGLTVVGDTGDGAYAVELCARTRPEVMVIDPALPDLTGVEVVRSVLARDPQLRVIVLTSTVDGQSVRDLRGVGACGYLCKRIDRCGLLAAIRGAVEGRRSIEAPAVHSLAGRSSPEVTGLTRRELQVLQLVARGMTNKVVAQELGISPGTVRIHVSGILAKLGVANRTEAAMVALRRGLVDPR